MSRAERRYQKEKKKKKVVDDNYHGINDVEPECLWGSKERTIGMLAKTPQICSCWMCRNERKSEGKTRQEKQKDIELKDYFKE